MTKSRVIYKGAHYTACAMANGMLVITHNRKRGGRYVAAPESTKWIEAIETADDNAERHALCRAIIHA